MTLMLRLGMSSTLTLQLQKVWTVLGPEFGTDAGKRAIIVRDTQTDRQTYRKTDRQTDKQTDRQTDRQNGEINPVWAG